MDFAVSCTHHVCVVVAAVVFVSITKHGDNRQQTSTHTHTHGETEAGINCESQTIKRRKEKVKREKGKHL